MPYYSRSGSDWRYNYSYSFWSDVKHNDITAHTQHQGAAVIRSSTSLDRAIVNDIDSDYDCFKNKSIYGAIKKALDADPNNYDAKLALKFWVLQFSEKKFDQYINPKRAKQFRENLMDNLKTKFDPEKEFESAFPDFKDIVAKAFPTIPRVQEVFNFCNDKYDHYESVVSAYENALDTATDLCNSLDEDEEVIAGIDTLFSEEGEKDIAKDLEVVHNFHLHFLKSLNKFKAGNFIDKVRLVFKMDLKYTDENNDGSTKYHIDFYVYSIKVRCEVPRPGKSDTYTVNIHLYDSPLFASTPEFTNSEIDSIPDICHKTIINAPKQDLIKILQGQTSRPYQAKESAEDLLCALGVEDSRSIFTGIPQLERRAKTLSNVPSAIRNAGELITMHQEMVNAVKARKEIPAKVRDGIVDIYKTGKASAEKAYNSWSGSSDGSDGAAYSHEIDKMYQEIDNLIGHASIRCNDKVVDDVNFDHTYRWRVGSAKRDKQIQEFITELLNTDAPIMPASVPYTPPKTTKASSQATGTKTTGTNDNTNESVDPFDIKFPERDYSADKFEDYEEEIELKEEYKDILDLEF